MTRLTHWLARRFLPALAREKLLEENERLQQLLQAEREHTARLQAYIDGMQTALRLSLPKRKEAQGYGRSNASNHE